MIRIGQIRRGKNHPKYPSFKNINVTSGSMNKLGNLYAKSLSPLKGDTHPVKDTDGLIFNNFENWWQANKAYKSLGHIDNNGNLTQKFWDRRKKWASTTIGKRHLPDTKTIKGYIIPDFGWYEGKKMNYQEARYAYLRKYCETVKNLPIVKALIDLLMNGQNIMILDFDGPSLEEYPHGIEVTWESLNEKMIDLRFPFGHGYVISAILLYILENKKK